MINSFCYKFYRTSPFLMLILLRIDGVLAQAPNPGYYKPNYADSTLDKNDPAPKDWSLRGSKVTESKEVSKKVLSPTITPTLNQELKEVSDKKDRKHDTYAGLKITAVGVLLNAEQDLHREEILGQLTRFSESTGIKVGIIYSMGGMVATFHSPSRKALVKQGARIKFLAEPPNELSFIKSSPTWILSTEKGDLIVEAPVKLADLTAPDGTFMPPLEQSAVLVREMVVKESEVKSFKKE